MRKLKPREGIARTQTWTPGSHSGALSAPSGFIPQDQELWGRRVCGHWQGSVPEPGRERPDPPLILSVAPSQGLVGSKWQVSVRHYYHFFFSI